MYHYIYIYNYIYIYIYMYTYKYVKTKKAAVYKSVEKMKAIPLFYVVLLWVCFISNNILYEYN